MKNGCCPDANKLALNGSDNVSRLIEPIVNCSNSDAILSSKYPLSCAAPILAKYESCDNEPLEPVGLVLVNISYGL